MLTVLAAGFPASAFAFSSTTTTLGVTSATPIVRGNLVTLTATVTGNALDGNPTGAVVFTVDGNAIVGATPILLQPYPDGASAKWQLQTTSLPVGQHVLGAEYAPADWTTGGGVYDGSRTITGVLVTVLDNAPQLTNLALTSNPDPVVPGSPATFTAVVTDAGNTRVPTGAVTFADNDQTLGVVALQNGVAVLPNILGFAGGTNTITASYGGDGVSGSAAASLSFTVPELPVKFSTETTVTVSSTVIHAGDVVTAIAHVVQTPGSHPPAAGALVTFSVNGVTAGNGQVLLAADGTATVRLDSFIDGANVIEASYMGDQFDVASSGHTVVSVVPSSVPLSIATSLTTVMPTTASVGATIHLSSTLTDSQHAALAGFSVTLSLGAQTCQATTASTGVATCELTVSLAPGPYTTTASFAGQGTYLATNSTGSFTVTKATTTVRPLVTGPVLDLSRITLSGVLLSGTVPVVGRTLTLTLGWQSCVGVTDSTGTAKCTIVTLLSLGPTTSTATFAGDDSYVSSTNSQSALLYLFPVGGAFVIGDLSASGTVTFWSSQWSKVNRLSRGTAPSSFKGFAATGSRQCGVGWSSRGGDSSEPTEGHLPTYMAVIVADSVTKSGSAVSGTTTHIVIVKTDAGYKNDPGHAGTGTVVATVC